MMQSKVLNEDHGQQTQQTNDSMHHRSRDDLSHRFL